ncbi:MAG: choice-of-anchor J domain-containing protein [Marinilabiliaceae bacterium]|nr:choice-of-anchor J domain-containing protein [Marinilabiliaceae bacterium]
MKKQILICLFAIFTAFTTLFAAYLENVPYKLVLPNGEQIDVFITGDEFYRRVHDSDGYSIVRGDDGWYYYAIYDAENDQLIPSEFKLSSIRTFELPMEKYLGISHEKYMEIRRQWFEPTNCNPAGVPDKSLLQDLSNAKTTQQINNIVICIGFSDTPSMSVSHTYVDGILNTYPDNNVRDFFSTMSYDKIDVLSHFYPPPNETILRFYQDSNPRAYYSPHSEWNPIGYTPYERAEREQSLLANAIQWVNENWPVPTQIDLDTNNDDYCDYLTFVVQGDVDGWNDLLWPHKWSLYLYSMQINGKYIWDYNFMLDGSTTYLSTNVFCHEGYHVLGAPDLYHYSNPLLDNDEPNGQPVGGWDLMEYSYLTKPQSMSAYMKYEYGNWVTSLPIATINKTYEIYPFYYNDGSDPEKPVIWRIPMTGTNTQYSVIEYRKKFGTNYDYYIPGEGLLIYRINSIFSGNAGFNGTSVFDEVYLYRPGGAQTTGLYPQGNLNQAAFPNNGNSSFNSTTNPKPCQSNGTAENVLNINNIKYNSANDSYSFFYGDPSKKKLIINQNELILNKQAGSDATVNITSNVFWTISIPTSAESWLSASATYGINDGTVTFTTLTENTSGFPKFATIIITDNDISFELNITQSHSNDIFDTFGLKVEVSDYDALFKWNQFPELFFDDMESHPDFIISDIGDYILHDLDGSSTFMFGGSTTFPNMGYVGSFIVFNPSQIPGAGGIAAMQPFSGDKYLACFAAVNPPNNDWLVLPKLTIVDGMILKFWAKSYNAQTNMDRFKVGISTTDSDPNDFTFITPEPYQQVPDNAWTQYSYSLSDYAEQDIFIAINCVSNRSIIFMLDDIFVGIPSIQNLGTQNATYTVFLDGMEVENDIQDSEFLFPNLQPGLHTAGVKAVHESGSTTINTIDFYVHNVDITSNIQQNIIVFGKSNKVYIVNENSINLKSVQILDMLGRVIYQGNTKSSTEIELNVSSGHYIVKLVSDDGRIFVSKVNLK